MFITAATILRITQQFVIYSYCLILSFGLIGGLSNILVFTFVKVFRRNQCAFYLIVISTTDCCLLLTILPIRLSELAFNIDIQRASVIWCKLRPMASYIFTLTSFSSICFASLDQYLSTNHNSRLKEFSTLKLAHRLTYSAIIIWILYDCLFLIFFDLRPSSGCAIYNIYFANFFSFFHLTMMTGVIPISIASMFSILAYLNVRRIVQLRMTAVRRKLERQLTAMVLAKVSFYAVIAVPAIVLRIYALQLTMNSSDPLQLAIGQLISSISIALYYANAAVCSLG